MKVSRWCTNVWLDDTEQQEKSKMTMTVDTLQVELVDAGERAGRAGRVIRGRCVELQPQLEATPTLINRQKRAHEVVGT